MKKMKTLYDTREQEDLLFTHYAWDRVRIQFLLWWPRHCCRGTRKGPWHAWLGSSHVSPELTCALKHNIFNVFWPRSTFLSWLKWFMNYSTNRTGQPESTTPHSRIGFNDHSYLIAVGILVDQQLQGLAAGNPQGLEEVPQGRVSPCLP